MHAEVNPWWERFFDEGNGLQWPTISRRESPWAEHVLPWVDLAQGEDNDIPVVLPRLDADGQPSWYCAGRSPRGTLRLREALQAFIGPSYSDFDGRPYRLQEEDPIDAAFAEATVAPIYRIRASKRQDVARIQRVLALYRGLLARMPKQLQHVQRPLGSLRAELDLAVVSGDEHEANRLLQRIRAIGRLDAENLLYLEVGVRAGLGHWRAIAEDGELLANLTGLRLPPRVLSDIHEALYRLYVEPSEDSEDPEQALLAFKNAGLARRTTLFGTRRGVKSPSVLKAFYLYELAREDTQQPILADLASELQQLDDAFAHALVSLHPSAEQSTTQDPMSAADAAFDDLDIDRALNLYLQAPPSKKRLSRLILCAEDVGTEEAARRVLDAITPGDDADGLPQKWAVRLTALQEKVSPDTQSFLAPRGWVDWARQVDAGMEEDQALFALREYMPTWNPQELSHNKQSLEELTRIINNSGGTAETVFREAMPLLSQTLIRESGTPPRQIKPLLLLLVTKVALLPDPSRGELELALDLARTLFTLGVDRNEYRSLISDFEDLIDTQISMFTLGWCLDLAELLANNICPDSEARLRSVLRVIEVARQLAYRLTPMDSLIISRLCKDYNIDCPAEFSEQARQSSDDDPNELTGKYIGIYTLTETAGQRAASLLQTMYQEVKVDINSDHECTKALSHLARSADCFIFAWKSSKHQAFYCIKDHRDPATPMIQAQGKGTSSILRAILQAQ